MNYLVVIPTGSTIHYIEAPIPEDNVYIIDRDKIQMKPAESFFDIWPKLTGFPIYPVPEEPPEDDWVNPVTGHNGDCGCSSCHMSQTQ